MFLKQVGERLNLEGFLKEGEELPNVIAKLLGQERNLKNNVLFTTSKYDEQLYANKQMYDSLSKSYVKSRTSISKYEAAAQSCQRNNECCTNW